MTVTVFFLNDGGGFDGKIRVQFVAPGSPSGDTTVSLGITGPDGRVVKLFPASPDLAIAAGFAGTIDLLIPLNSDGSYVAGEYLFQVAYTSPGSPDIVDWTASYQYSPVVNPSDPSAAAANLSASYDCLTGKITSQDTTVLPEGATLSSRVIRILPPSIAGQPSPVAQIETTPTATTDILWDNAPYQITLDRRHITTVDLDVMTVQLWEKFVASVTLNIVCDLGLCEAAACMAAEFESLEAEACGVGGWAMLTAKQKAKLEKTMYRTVISLAYHQCGNFNKAAEWAASADDCDCGCGETKTPSGPIPYTPPIG